ncbi:translin family protein [Aspergillus clavatus NRRL 1]|uniref:Translin-associated factor TraX, putative n=1 Tax=Aspergillus clavatus (strain ATCC 1007 / CBS 513.65 / DSM 816 / NCTC 3887 / NRRL 1 / QM 1276 / 107) TaxID=344612 RepID=A1CGA7_ASPCL|nr:translin-associated factor TraX, putative [Aspergillus clavatus NRRL 1]EAW10987.1 translin-associated factor TraX, putative [Aspergillus clavatus NRRL 1]
MAGTKRSWEGKLVSDESTHTKMAAAHLEESSSLILTMFETFRDELDEHHDRRERVIKTSRDITALSKKMCVILSASDVFLEISMHRYCVRTINAPIPTPIAKETQTRFDQITTLFRSVIPDVTGLNSWRYQRQLSGAIQEFIEALSFHHYLQTQSLISLPEVAAQLPAEILVTHEDYVLGLFDLTGEMMRFAVTALSTGGQAKPARKEQEGGGDVVINEGGGEGEAGGPADLPRLPPSQAGIVVDLRDMRSSFELISVPRRHGNHMYRDMGKKVDVMRNSVEKVERAAYGILVRGSERPSGWTPDLSGNVDMEVY